MNVKAVFTILQMIIPAIQTAEEFIRGAGRGTEKKEAVLGKIGTQIIEARKELAQTGEMISNNKSYNWIQFALEGPEFLAKVGAVIDAIVDLGNFVQKFDNVEQTPEKAVSIN